MLKGKLAVVTGANRGIGFAVLEVFAKNGCSLLACARHADDPKLIDHLHRLSQEYRISAHPISLELSDEASVKLAAKAIFGFGKPIDILVNNAGIASGGLFQTATIDEMKRVFSINFFSQILLTQYIARKMINSKSGSIINISSSASYVSDPGTLIYGSSKAAFSRATQSLATELGSFNIRVNAIAPGLAHTDMYDQMDDAARSALINRSALKRAADPSEIANAALFLASDLSSFITGQIIRVDGGIC